MISLLSTSILLLTLFHTTSSTEYEFSSILYDFNGTCNNTYLCLPFSNISFSSIWENTTKEEIIKELNKEVKKCPSIKRKVFFKESRVNLNDIVIIFLGEFFNRVCSQRKKSILIPRQAHLLLKQALPVIWIFQCSKVKITTNNT